MHIYHFRRQIKTLNDYVAGLFSFGLGLSYGAKTDLEAISTA